ncbi:hypothetical protein [Stakelama marina]|uniref:Uncharacterized protein n=1 Tax=Stakelama marina TaxID=2826939 RepID=A0A8T4IC93_9SPHN|nr:hypothetical protein [Stakelama marina]MBR0551722.1 hypothetical protein [Stakelama marina]
MTSISTAELDPAETLTSPAVAPEFEFADLASPFRGWVKLIGPACAVALLAAAFWMAGRGDLDSTFRLLPARPQLWLMLAAYLAITPLCDFVIFRRLWKIPGSGLAALFRKSASNDVLLGYLGEVQFYAWARRHADLAGSPFGAVKDVAILSAMVGNAVTLALLCVAWPFIGHVVIGKAVSPILWSIAVLLGSSMAVGLLRNRILSLGARDCWYVSGIHLLRTLLATAMVALLWHEILPSVAAQWWLLMAAGRQLVTRLPFLPNKDVAFAGLAVLITGSSTEATSAVLLVGTLIFAGQVIVGSVLALAELARSARKAS